MLSATRAGSGGKVGVGTAEDAGAEAAWGDGAKTMVTGGGSKYRTFNVEPALPAKPRSGGLSCKVSRKA